MQIKHATTEAKGTVSSQTAWKIKVNGERHYEYASFHWRQAIKQFLVLLWTDRFGPDEVIDLFLPSQESSDGYEPGVVLRYSAVTKSWEAFGSYNEGMEPTFRWVRSQSVLRVDYSGVSGVVEIALARFAWNQQIRALGILLPQGRHMKSLWLWSSRRGIMPYENIRDS
ncbi:hypothetical protein HY415_01780 [Candidatus Kaiserbacteria bacterium]|nr:hypothetical protein [Candidatus Kaiserbacteria bacterium]